MNENNQQEPSIEELINQGEEMEKEPQSFFKKPTIIAGTILVIIALAVLIFVSSGKSPLQPTPLTEEHKQAIEQRVQGEIPPITEEQKSQIQKRIENTETPQLTPEEKSEIERRIMNQ